MLRLVLDTDAVVAALRSPKGASAALLAAADQGNVRLLVSVALALEYQAVCTRAEHVLAANVTPGGARNFVRAVIALAEPVIPHFLWRPQLSDAADEMVLEAAVNGRADVLTTFNLRHFKTASARFGIETLTPSETLRRISQ